MRNQMRMVGLALTMLLVAGSLSLATAEVTSAAPAPIYVDASATGLGDGSQEAPYQTVQEAVYWVADGGTINIGPGDYSIDSTIELDKAVTISGPDEGMANLVGTSAAAVTIFEVGASNVTIENLVLTVSEMFADYPPIVPDEAATSLIRIPTPGAGDSAVSGIVIRDNTLYVPAQEGPMSDWNARAVTVDDGATTGTGVTITGNTVYNTRNGIVIRTNNVANISDNTIYNTKGGIMNYTANAGDAADRTMSGNSWGEVHNEWDIVWNTAHYIPDYQESVLNVSWINNDAFVVDRRAADAAACTALTGNRSHAFVEAGGSIETHPTRGNLNEPYGTLQLGIEAVTPGGIVLVAAGDYDGATVDRPLTLQGIASDTADPNITGTLIVEHAEAIEGTYLKDLTFDAGGGHSLVLDGVDNVAVESCRFDGNERFMDDPHVNAIELKSGCDDILIEDCTIENGYYVAVNGYANNLTVRDSTISNCKSGINLQSGNNLAVTGTDMSVVAQGAANDTYCIRFANSSTRSSGMSVTGGTFAVNPNGLTPDEGTYHSAVVVRSEAAGDLAIHGAVIDGEVVNLSTTSLNATRNYWAHEAGPDADCIEGLVVYDPWYTGYNLDELATAKDVFNTTRSTTHDTIQEAVDEADEGDVIEVAEGTYGATQILVEKGLTLRGAGAGLSIIDGQDSVLASSGTLRIANNSSQVLVEGFTFQSAGGTSGAIAGICARGSTAPVVIRDCHFIGRGDGNLYDMGIWVYSTRSGGTVIIKDNEFEGMWQGILLELPRGGAQVVDNSFHDVLAGDDGNYEPEGLFAFTYDGPDNDVTEPIIVSGNTFADFSGVSIAFGAGYPGEAMSSFTDIEISDNTIESIDGGASRPHMGILFRNYGADAASAASGGIRNATISGNTIAGSGGANTYGVWLHGVHSDISIVANTISGVDKGIAVEEKAAGTGYASGVQATRNSITENTVGITNDSTTSVDARGNYWGDGVDPAGVVEGPVDLDPWYVDEAMTTLATNASVLNVSSRKSYGTIQDAVDEALPGDTIQVAAGDYSESIVIDKHLILQGAGSDEEGTVILPPSDQHGITIRSGASGASAASRTVISGLRVSGINNAERQAVRFDSNSTISHVTLERVAAVGNEGYGFGFREMSTYEDIVLEDVIADGNSVGIDVRTTNVSFDGFTIAGGRVVNNEMNGLHINGGSGTVTNVTIQGTHFANNAVGAPQGTGRGNITLYEFNGDASLIDVTVDATGAEYGMQLSGGWDEATTPSGTVVFSGVEITGAPVNYGLVVSRYSDMSKLSFENVTIDVDLESGESVNKLNKSRAALFMQDVAMAQAPYIFDLGSITFAGDRGVDPNRPYDFYGKGYVDFDATDVVFSASDNFEIEDLVYHKLDDANHSLVTWVANNEFVTPDSGSIANALKKAKTGWTINVAPGTYTGDIVIEKNAPGASQAGLTLKGANFGQDPDGSTDRGGESVIDGTVTIKAKDVTLNGFTLTGPVNVGYVDGDNVNISYNIFDGVNAQWGAVHLHGTAGGPSYHEADGAYVGYNTISGTVGRGIMTVGNDDVVIEHNHVDGVSTYPDDPSTGHAIDVCNHVGEGIVIRNNTITDPEAKGINYWGGDGPTISGNTVADAGTWAIFTDKRALISNNDIERGTDGIRTNYNGTSADDRVEITGNTISDVQYAGIAFYNVGWTYVDDNTIDNCLHGVEAGGHSGNATVISGNIITDSQSKGINYWAGDNATISDNVITNTINEGIFLSGDAIPKSKGHMIEGNTVEGAGSAAIRTYAQAIITGNTVTDSMDGIVVSYAGSDAKGDFVEVTGNTVSLIKYAGINIHGAHTYVHGNTVHDCNYYGSDGLGDWDYASIHLEPTATNCTIDGNTVYDGVNGIQTWANDTTITDNEIYDMGKTYDNEKIVGDRTYKNSAILVGSNWGSGDIDPTGILIENNSIRDNYWGLFHSADLTEGVTAAENWWGNPHRQAIAEIVDTSDFAPWYMNQAMDLLSNELTLTVTPGVGGSVEVGDGQGNTYPPETKHEYGGLVVIKAMPDKGWKLVGWGGDAAGNSSEITVTIDGVKNITATFGEMGHSTYGFKYGVPRRIMEDRNYAIDVTLEPFAEDELGYDAVLFQVEVDGPGTVTLMATDTNGVEHDIAAIGYWGPAGGFPIGPEYTATTEITARFSNDGEYTITFSLLDVSVDPPKVLASSEKPVVVRERTETPAPGPGVPPVLPPVIAPSVTEVVDTSTGGKVELEDGSAAVELPPNATEENVTVTLSPVVDEVLQPTQGMVMIGGKIYEITAETDAGEMVTQFSQPLALTFTFTEEELDEFEADEEDLRVFYWDEDAGAWIALPTTVDPTTGTVTALTDHFTVFALMAKPDMPAMPDIAAHWAEKYILRLVSLGVVGGYEDESYRPEAEVTRQEFAKMVVLAAGLEPDAEPALTFADNDQIADWAKGYVSAAVNAGIINGLEGNRFGPTEPVTRAQAATMIMRALGIQATGTPEAFGDDATIPEWARAAVQAAIEKGVINGFEDNTFRPSLSTTRAQAAKMLSRLTEVRFEK